MSGSGVSDFVIFAVLVIEVAAVTFVIISSVAVPGARLEIAHTPLVALYAPTLGLLETNCNPAGN